MGAGAAGSDRGGLARSGLLALARGPEAAARPSLEHLHRVVVHVTHARFVGLLALPHLLPRPHLTHVLPAEPDALVVVRVQREDALEYALRFRESVETP